MAEVVSIADRRGRADRAGGAPPPGVGAGPTVPPRLDAILAELQGRETELLAVIEGLRANGSAGHGAAGSLAADLDALTCRALAEVGLLIRRTRRASMAARGTA